MKKEDIYNGVTEIRDDIIEKAEKKSNKRIWRGAVAAVLALSIAVAGVAVWRRNPSADIPDGDAAPSGNTAMSNAASRRGTRSSCWPGQMRLRSQARESGSATLPERRAEGPAMRP